MHFIRILVTELSNKEISKPYRLHVLLLIAYMFTYNSKLTLKILNDIKVLIPVCQNFFSSLKKYTETEQFRGLIYGITSLINTDDDLLPAIIKSSMPMILESLIKLMHKYTKEREREVIDKLEEKISGVEEETEELTVQKQQLERLKEIAKAEIEDESEEEDDDELLDDDYLWARTDSFYYKGKLEQLEAPLYFRDVLQKMNEERNEVYVSLTGVISEANKALLERIIERWEFIQSLNPS
jgi:hypothetical protein